MNYITHSLGGVVVGMAAMSVATTPTTEVSNIMLMSGAVIGSLFPDIDHSKSFISNKLKLVSTVTATVFKHRGFTHTPVFIALMAVVLIIWKDVFLTGQNSEMLGYFMSGFLPGMLSHLILDTMNVQGISWLWPITKEKFHILTIRTGSSAEIICTAFLILAIFYTVLI